LIIICTFGSSSASHLAIVFGNFNLWASHSFQVWSFDYGLLHFLEFILQSEFSFFTLNLLQVFLFVMFFFLVGFFSFLFYYFVRIIYNLQASSFYAFTICQFIVFQANNFHYLSFLGCNVVLFLSCHD
jgi:hypothetical protein